MSIITLEKRNPTTKAKALRKSGFTPCVIFGAALPESISAQLPQSEAKQLLRSQREGSRVELQLNGDVIPAQIKDASKDFATSEIIHISFQMLERGKKVNSKAQIALLNKEKLLGTLEQLVFEIPYTALPKDMVDTVTIDLEGLPVESVITVADLPAFQGGAVEPLIDAESVILKVKEKKRLSKEEEAAE